MTWNEEKYEKSYVSYENLNKECFETMIKVLSKWFKIITPTVGRYMTLMQNLYSNLNLRSV